MKSRDDLQGSPLPRSRAPQGRRGTPERQRTAPSPRWTRERLELDVAALVAAGDEAGAAAAAFGILGAEVFGFLLAVLDRGTAARDAYALVAERVRREIGSFGWRCSLRTWIYAIAREELRRQPAAAADSSPAPVTLPDPTTTVPCRRTGLGAAIASLRGGLPVDDRAILILRVDRRLALADLAVTELGERASPGDLRREAGRLRERLGRIRDALGRAAVEHRLLDPR